VKSTSKYLRRNLVTLAASGKARKILSEPAFSGGDAENSLPVVRRPFDCSKCNRNTSMRVRKNECIGYTYGRENIEGLAKDSLEMLHSPIVLQNFVRVYQFFRKEYDFPISTYKYFAKLILQEL